MTYVYKTYCGLFFLLSTLFYTTASYADITPFSSEYKAEMLEIFFDGNRQLSQEKLQVYKERIARKKLELVGVVDGKLVANSVLALKYENRSKKKKLKKISEHEYSIAFDIIDEKLFQVEKASNYDQQLFILASVLEIENAMRKVGVEYPGRAVRNALSALIKRWKVSKVFNANNEATNLLASDGINYLSPDQLGYLYNQGYDLSLINPPNSGFWTKPNNKGVPMEEVALGATMPLYDFKAVEMPAEGSTFYFDEVKRSATKPKMNVYYKHKGEKIKLKLKVGAELHSDPTAAALMMSLGFAADVTQYRKNVKVVLKDSSFEELKLQWETYYSRDNYRLDYPIEKFISSRGVTSKGDEYIVFNEGLIEAKPDDLLRLGSWGFRDLGHHSFREARALLLVQMWINNVDLKFENNKVILKKISDKFEIFNINSDPGKSFGSFLLQEKPDALNPKMVKDVSSKEVTLRYRSSFNSPVKNEATYSDIRWAVRLIASLSRAQIEGAVENGKWPNSCFKSFYSERLISRRNDLVKGFDLLGEIPLIAEDTKFNTNSFSKVCGIDPSNIENSTINFDNRLSVYTNPILKTSRDLVLRTIRGFVNSVNNVRVDSLVEGVVGDDIYLRIIAAPSREVELNPNPKSADELYIVKDSVEIGVGPGIGNFLYAEMAYSKKYTLSYAARSLKEAETRNSYIADIFLPLHLSKDELPKKYVLTVDHLIQNTVGARTSPTANFGLGVEVEASKKLVYRSVIDKSREDKYLVYGQKTHFLEASGDVFLRFIFLKLSLYDNLSQWSGKIDGKGGTFEAKELESNPEKLKALHDIIEKGDVSKLEPYLNDFYLLSDFKKSFKKLNLIAWSQEKEKRLDKITYGNNEKSESQLQYLSSQQSKYSLVDPEGRRKVIQLYTSQDIESDDYEMRLTLHKHDGVTTDKELGDYLNLINAMGRDERIEDKIIPFTPSLGYARNKLWGSTFTTIEASYYPEALEKMLSIPESDYLQTMQQMSCEDRCNSDDAIKITEKFLKYLEKAKEAETKPKKMKYLAKAFRKSLKHKGGFYNPFILRLVNKSLNYNGYYATGDIAALPFQAEVFLEGEKLRGRFGVKQKSNRRYVNLNTLTPIEHFNFLTDLISDVESIED